ncbi:MAG: helix-turn-helix domain-containing protein [Candidatus Aenigmatarchaeota archaeon]
MIINKPSSVFFKKNYYTVKETSNIINKSASYVYEKIRNGEIKYFKVGKVYVIPAYSLRKLLK